MRRIKEALEEAPGSFELMLVAHSRYFINRLSQKIWELDQGASPFIWAL